MVLATDGERFAIVRRPDSGLLAGLFEPLNFPGHLSEPELLSALSAVGIAGGAVRSVSPLENAKHIFTHIEWQMRGYLVMLSELPDGAQVLFRTEEEIASAYAIPSAYRVYVKCMKRVRKSQRKEGI